MKAQNNQSLLLETKYKAKLGISWGEVGAKQKNPSMGGVWVFSGTALFVVFSIILLDFCGQKDQKDSRVCIMPCHFYGQETLLHSVFLHSGV